MKKNLEKVFVGDVSDIFEDEVKYLRKRAKEMEKALQIIHTWATFRDGIALNPKDTTKLCEDVFHKNLTDLNSVALKAPFKKEDPEFLIQKFNKLKDQWIAETAFLSDTTKICRHSSYRKIIKMGESVIPLILRDIENSPKHWFVALQCLTKANPVPKIERGHMQLMTNSWLLWGAKNGYRK